MDFATACSKHRFLLMEGALGERLKRECGLAPDPAVALAAHVYSAPGERALRALWGQYASAARECGLPFVATTPTRRVNRARLAQSPYGEEIIPDNLRLLRRVQAEAGVEMYAGGLMGCRGDAYAAEGALGEAEAFDFHRWAAERFARAGADFLMAGIMPALGEAIGMARAMEESGLPYLISFMIRRDGNLIDGTPIARAIAAIDGAVSRPPLFYMVNCVHPAVLLEALDQPVNQDPCARARFGGIQANTSPLPPEQLDGAKDLHCAKAEELAADMARLLPMANMKLFGGCCGTDQSHIRAIAAMLAAARNGQRP